MQVFWFIPTHGDSHYLGTSQGAHGGFRLSQAGRRGGGFAGIRRRADSHRAFLRGSWVAASALAAVTRKLRFWWHCVRA